jgi:hypothetical protein
MPKSANYSGLGTALPPQSHRTKQATKKSSQLSDLNYNNITIGNTPGLLNLIKARKLYLEVKRGKSGLVILHIKKNVFHGHEPAFCQSCSPETWRLSAGGPEGLFRTNVPAQQPGQIKSMKLLGIFCD